MVTVAQKALVKIKRIPADIYQDELDDAIGNKEQNITLVR